MSSPATSRFRTTACEYTPAPLVAALALLGISGMMMMSSFGAGTPSQAPAVAAAPPVPAPEATKASPPVPSAPTAAAPVQKAPPAELPKVQLRLEPDGKLYFKDDELTEEDVMADLSKSSVAVILIADEKAPLPALLNVMRWLKNAGIAHTAVELQKPAP